MDLFKKKGYPTMGSQTLQLCCSENAAAEGKLYVAAEEA